MLLPALPIATFPDFGVTAVCILVGKPLSPATYLGEARQTAWHQSVSFNKPAFSAPADQTRPAMEDVSTLQRSQGGI
jgi:hypothetical protein